MTYKLDRNRSDIHAIHEKLSVTPLQSATEFNHAMRQYRTIEAAKNILDNKLPNAFNPGFCCSLVLTFRHNADTVPLEIRSDFVIALNELQCFADMPEGSAFTTVSLNITLSTIYPASTGDKIKTTAYLARPQESISFIGLDCSDSQAAFLAPTARDTRSQRRDAIRRETSDKPPSSPIETIPLDSFPRQPLCPPYEESSGSAKVQRNLPQLEALMRQLQSAIVPLKNEDK